jgi:hypothetical protein
MSIQLSPEQRGHLEQLARRRSKPTRRQKAIALLRLAEGDPPEKAAECAGMETEDVETLASDFNERGLDGIGLDGSEGARRSRVPSLKDDALFEQYRRILEARRKRRALEESTE